MHFLSIKNKEKQYEFINILNDLSELRGWLWEIYENNKPENIADINDEIKKMLTEAGETIGLIYIND